MSLAQVLPAVAGGIVSGLLSRPASVAAPTAPTIITPPPVAAPAPDTTPAPSPALPPNPPINLSDTAAAQRARAAQKAGQGPSSLVLSSTKSRQTTNSQGGLVTRTTLLGR